MYDNAYSTVGSGLISLSTQVITWLLTNFIGTMYLFFILMILFSVVFYLGGHNR